MRAGRSRSQPASILIVDNDPSVTETFLRILTPEGYQVYTACDAEAGLREAGSRHPDAIIVDLRMPLIDGYEFLARLRAREDQRQTPVAIITGDFHLKDGLVRALREFGATLYFKPVWRDDLIGIAQRLLASE